MLLAKRGKLNLVKDDSSRAPMADVNQLFQIISPEVIKLVVCTYKRPQTH